MTIQKNETIINAVLITSLLMIFIPHFVDSLNYLRYLSIGPLLLLVSMKFRQGYLLSTFKLFLVFLIFGSFVTLSKFEFSSRFIAESLLIILPIIYVIFFNNIRTISNKHIKYFFLLTIISMVLENFTEIFNLIANPNSILEGLKTSQLGTESHFGLLFGFFFIYFFVTKANKKFTIWAFVFLIIAFKRIAIAASILSVIIYLIYRNSKFTKSVKLNANLLMFFSLMLFMFLLINLSLGVYDTWIKDNIGLSANHFTMGRAQMYKRVLENLEVGFIGTGQGTVTEFLEGLNFKKMNRLHSDFLRNHIEIGFGFYTIWILLFNKLNIFNLKALVILVYYWVVLVTDNAFIYFDFLALFYMIQTIFYEEK